MVLVKIFNTILSQILVVASKKIVSRIVLPYKSIYNNCDIFYDKMVLLFFMNTIAKPRVKRFTDGGSGGEAPAARRFLEKKAILLPLDHILHVFRVI